MNETWEHLCAWLEGDGAAWTQWALLGTIETDIADDVLKKFGIAPTEAARARLRREVNAAEFEPVSLRPWW